MKHAIQAKSRFVTFVLIKIFARTARMSGTDRDTIEKYKNK